MNDHDPVIYGPCAVPPHEQRQMFDALSDEEKIAMVCAARVMGETSGPFKEMDFSR